MTENNLRTCPNKLCSNYGVVVAAGKRCPICSTPVYSPIPGYNRYPPYASRLITMPILIAFVILVTLVSLLLGSRGINIITEIRQTQEIYALATGTQDAERTRIALANTNATLTKQAENARSTTSAEETALAPSATPTRTPSPTLTPTDTYTPSPTPTPTLTDTPIPPSLYTLSVVSVEAESFVTVGNQTGLSVDREDDIGIKFSIEEIVSGQVREQNETSDQRKFTDEATIQTAIGNAIQVESVPSEAQIKVCFELRINPSATGNSVDDNKVIDSEKCDTYRWSDFEDQVTIGKTLNFNGASSISPMNEASLYNLKYEITRIGQ